MRDDLRDDRAELLARVREAVLDGPGLAEILVADPDPLGDTVIPELAVRSRFDRRAWDALDGRLRQLRAHGEDIPEALLHWCADVVAEARRPPRRLNPRFSQADRDDRIVLECAYLMFKGYSRKEAEGILLDALEHDMDSIDRDALMKVLQRKVRKRVEETVDQDGHRSIRVRAAT